MSELQDQIESEIQAHMDELEKGLEQATGLDLAATRRHFMDVVGQAQDLQAELDVLETFRARMLNLRDEINRTLNLMGVRIEAVEASLRIYNK